MIAIMMVLSYGLFYRNNIQFQMQNKKKNKTSTQKNINHNKLNLGAIKHKNKKK